MKDGPAATGAAARQEAAIAAATTRVTARRTPKTRWNIAGFKSLKPAFRDVKNTAVEKLLNDRGRPVEKTRVQHYFRREREQIGAVALC